MKRRPQPGYKPALVRTPSISSTEGDIGIVLSGGGARAAYQVGALRALSPYLEASKDPITTVVGSSIGAVNGLILSACLKTGFSSALDELEGLWRERNFRNSFQGSPSRAFFRAIKVATFQLRSPGPSGSTDSIFDPTPLRNRLDEVIEQYGGLTPEARHPALTAVAVMTTIEGAERKPLLFASTHKRVPEETLQGASFEVCYVEKMTAKHGFASAALPHVLPPVELDTEAGKVRLVDGGISDNFPIDPAVRLGAHRVILIDISGRDWWHDRSGEPHDTRPLWEVCAAPDTYCMRPPETLILRCLRPLGPILREAVGSSTRRFIASVGPVWPLFTVLKNKLGEDVAYEVMSYVALDGEFLAGVIERGYNESKATLDRRKHLHFTQMQTEKKAS